MNKIYQCMAILLIVFSSYPAFGQSVFSLAGYYSTSSSVSAGNKLNSSASDSPNTVEVDVFSHNNNQYVDWSVRQNPSGKTIGGVFPANLTNNKMAFKFTDGWGNKGSGNFSKTTFGFALEIKVVDKNGAIGSMVTGLYGKWALKKISGTPREDRHTWSLTRIQHPQS